MQKPNIVLMMGEPHGVQKAMERWKKAFIEKHGDLNLEEYDTEEAGVDPAFQAAHVPPFLGEKRLIILKNIISGQKKADRDACLKSLEAIPDFTVLLMTETQAEWTEKERGAWEKTATLHDFKKESAVEQREAIERRLAREGLKAPSHAIQKLIDAAGHDAWTLEQELEKWVIQMKMVGPAASTKPDLSPPPIEENVFKWCDDLTARRSQAALSRLHSFQQNGEEILKILGLANRQFHLMLEVKAAERMGQTDSQTATRLKVQPFVVQKIKRELHRFTLEELKVILGELHALDLRIKTGQVHQSTNEHHHAYLLLELLVKKHLDALKNT